MTGCFAAGCSHRSDKEKCSFFRFPKEPRRRYLWIIKSRRVDRGPVNDSCLCSCHFRDGKKENGPTLFSYTKIKQRVKVLNPEKRKEKIRERNRERRRKHAGIHLLPSCIKIPNHQTITQLTNDNSHANSNGTTSSEPEKTITVAVTKLEGKCSHPEPTIQSVHKATLTCSEVLDVLYRQRRISEEAKNKLKTALPKGKDSSHVIEASAEGKKKQYSAQLRNFALSFYFYSFSAYVYAWRNYETYLPPPSALRKGYEISNIKSEPEYE